MVVGDKLDARVLGHDPIDLKSLLQAAGYVMPQGSVAKLPRIPGEVEAQIVALEADREKYGTLDEMKTFKCPFCEETNGSAWRTEVATGIKFLVCGNCHKVVEVQ